MRRLERPRSDRERLAVVGFVGHLASAEPLGRILRLLDRRPAAVSFAVAGGASAVGAPAPSLDRLARAHPNGSPLVGCVDWHDGSGRRARLAVFGLGHLGIASASRDGLSAPRLGHALHDGWVPPLQLSVVRALGTDPTPATLLASTSHEPGRLVASSSAAPLCIAVGDEGVLVSADVGLARTFSARLAFTRPGEVAVADAAGFDLLCARTLARVSRSPGSARSARAWTA